MAQSTAFARPVENITAERVRCPRGRHGVTLTGAATPPFVSVPPGDPGFPLRRLAPPVLAALLLAACSGGYVDSITSKIVPEGSVRAGTLLSGQLDVASQPPP